MSEKNPPPQQESIEKALKAFREAWFAGHEPDPDSFCDSYPQWRAELHSRIENFLMAVRVLPVAGDGGDESASTPREEKALNQGRYLGDFRIVSEIGRGGMGVVYEAEQVSLNRKVALKILPEHLSLSEQAVKKFQREAKAGGRQRHPGIVAVHAQGEHEGVHFIAQELVEGGRTLAEDIEKRRKASRLPRDHYRNAASTIAEVAEALTHAHRSGVIHRDVKPSNILINGEGQPKVTDFGLARIEDALSLSRSGDFAGTPFYMSPEQAAGRNSGIDHRTDIYSLGVTLYEMIALKKPFDGDTSQDVLKKIIFHEPRNPCRINPRIPRDLAVICLKAMEKQPKHRYASMHDMADDLQRFLAGETIRARPVGFIMRCTKWVQRNPVWSSALAMTTVALLVVLFALIWSNIQTQKRKEKAEEAEAQRLFIESSSSLSTNPGRGVLLAYEGAKKSRGVLADNTLLKAMMACHEEQVHTFSPGSRPVAMGPHGKKVLILTDEGDACIIDLATGNQLCTLAPVQGALYDARFSPDQRWVAVIEFLEEAEPADMHRVSLFNAETGNKTLDFRGHTRLIRNAAFSRTGDRLITASWDLTARVWDVSTGKCLSVLAGHNWHATCAAIDPMGELAVTGSEDAVVRLWDLKSAKLLKSFIGHEQEIRTVAFSPDSRMILSTAAEGTFHIWDVEKGSKLASNDGLEEELTTASFNKGGDKVVTAAVDGSVKVWEVEELQSYSRMEKAVRDSGSGKDMGDLIKEFRSMSRLSPLELRGHDASVFQAEFDPHNGRVFTLSHDRTMRVWKTESGLGCSQFQEKVPCTGLAISGDGSRLAWVSEGSTQVRVWDTIEGKLLHNLNIADRCFDDLDRSSYWVYEDEIYHPEKIGKEEWAIREPAESISTWECKIRSLQLNEQGTLLAVNLLYNTEQIWDLDTGKKLKSFLYHGDRRTFHFSEDGRCGILALESQRLQIFGIHDLSDHCFTPKADEFDCRYAGFDSSGTRILTLSVNGEARLWDRTLSQPIVSLHPEARSDEEEPPPASWARFIPGKQKIIAFYSDNNLRVWDVESGKKLLATFPCPEGGTFIPIMNGTGSRILEYTNTEELTIHYLSEDRSPIRLPSSKVNGGDRVLFSHDGRFVVTLTRKRLINIYNASTGELRMSTNRNTPIIYMSFSKDGESMITIFDDGIVQTWPINPVATLESCRPVKMSLEEWDEGRLARERERELEESHDDKGSKSKIETKIREQAELGKNEPLSDPTGIRLNLPRHESLFFIAKERSSSEKMWIMKHTPGQDQENEVVIPVNAYNLVDQALSPEGDRICFIAQDENDNGFTYILDLESHTQKCICKTGNTSASDPAWHPKGHTILFSMSENDKGPVTSSIFSIDPNGLENQEPVRVLGRPDHKFLQPHFSPDGSLLCFTYDHGTNNTHARDIYIAEYSENGEALLNPRRITSKDGRDEFAVFQSDSRLCWISSITNQNLGSVYSVDLPTGECSCLFEGLFLNAPEVSPLGFIAFPSDQRKTIRIVHACGSQVHSFKLDDMLVSSPIFCTR